MIYFKINHNGRKLGAVAEQESMSFARSHREQKPFALLNYNKKAKAQRLLRIEIRKFPKSIITRHCAKLFVSCSGFQLFIYNFHVCINDFTVNRLTIPCKHFPFSDKQILSFVVSLLLTAQNKPKSRRNRLEIIENII